jgi:hypothetical protein
MAKTKQTWAPKRVRSEDERGGGSSDYLTLDEGEKFQGYALFEGDPSQDEPGYYEYMEHWDQASRRSVPCAGDDCPFCEDGDRPRTRAKSLWLVTSTNKGDKLDPPELRIFNLNYNLIKQFTEMRGEGDKIKGKLFRVSKLDDRGNHSLVPKADTLKASEVKEHLKSSAAPDFDALVTGQLRKAMEGISVSRALDDDDDDDEDEGKKSKSKKSDKGAKDKKKSKAKAEPDDDDDDDDEKEWPDDGLDEATITVKKVEKEGNWIEATSEDYEGVVKVWTTEGIDFDLTDLSKGDEITVTTAAKDDDGEYVLSEEPEAAAEPEDEDEDEKEDDDENESNDLPDEIEDEEFEIVSIDIPESTMEVKGEELEFTLYILDTMEIDLDDYEEGDKIKVTAEKDSQGDLVATEVPTKVKAKKDKGGKAAKGGKKSESKKGGKAKGGKGGKKK